MHDIRRCWLTLLNRNFCQTYISVYSPNFHSNRSFLTLLRRWVGSRYIIGRSLGEHKSKKLSNPSCSTIDCLISLLTAEYRADWINLLYNQNPPTRPLAASSYHSLADVNLHQMCQKCVILLAFSVNNYLLA